MRINWLTVSLLCVVSGVVTALIANRPMGDTFWPSYPVGLPFAALTAVLFVRPWKRTAISFVVTSLVWQVAYFGALFTHDALRDYGSMIAAGWLGGLGVAGSMMLGCPRIRDIGRTALVGILGAIAAIPFGMWMAHFFDVRHPGLTDLQLLIGCFTIWQLVVGFGVFSICAGPQSHSQSVAHR